MRLSIIFKIRDFSNFYIEKEFLAVNLIFIKLIIKAPLSVKVYIYIEVLGLVSIIKSIK